MKRTNRVLFAIASLSLVLAACGKKPEEAAAEAAIKAAQGSSRGAVLLPGAKAPHLVKRGDLKTMKPGTVIVDVAVDQGGCVETIKPTTHENPTYFVEGILHYAVANMPGGVPRTSTLALTNATLPYALKLAKMGWRAACKADSALALGLNVVEGKTVYPGVAEAFRLPLTDVASVL